MKSLLESLKIKQIGKQLLDMTFFLMIILDCIMIKLIGNEFHVTKAFLKISFKNFRIMYIGA
jgi:hypothetical protein